MSKAAQSRWAAERLLEHRSRLAAGMAAWGGAEASEAFREIEEMLEGMIGYDAD